MASIQCVDCDGCAIRGECDAIDEMIEKNSCITDHSILLGIYERCKIEAEEECERCIYNGHKEQMEKHDAEVRKEAIDELKNELLEIIEGDEELIEWQKDEFKLLVECAFEKAKENKE